MIVDTPIIRTGSYVSSLLGLVVDGRGSCNKYKS